MKLDFLHNPAFHILLVLVFSLLAYSNTFHVPFQFDDQTVIIENPIIKDLRYYSEPSKAEKLKGTFQHQSFKNRYIGSLTFALNYKLHGLDVTGYHIFNLFVHSMNALLIYLLIVLSFNTPFLHTSRISNYAGHIAVCTALLFACHPVQTQAVTYIWQRVTSLATLFYLFSLLLYIKARLSSTSVSTVTWYAVSLISAVLAMKTKQIAFTLPVMIVLYEFLFFEGKIKKRILYLMPLLLTMLIIPLSLMDIDKPIGELIGDVSEVTRDHTDMSRGDYLITEFRVIVTYIRLIFLPVNQNLDYDYPVYHSFFDGEVWVSFLFLLSLFTCAGYLMYRSRLKAKSLRLISFGILWFFLAVSVESSIIPILGVIYEHRVYLPSIGVFLAISTAIFTGVERLKERGIRMEVPVIGMVAVIIVMLTGATYARNTVWKDEVSLWKDVVKKSPGRASGHNNLGIAYGSRGSVDEAIEQFQNAIRIDPDYSKAYNNLGNAYGSRGLVDEAIEQFQIATKLNPDYSKAHYNLGVAYKSQGLIDKAAEHFQIASRLDPGFLDFQNKPDNDDRFQNFTDKEIKQYQIEVQLKPDSAEAYYNLGVVYEAKSLIDKAIEHFQIAIRLDPDYSKAQYSLGRVYGSKGSVDRAIKHLQIAIRLNPYNAEAHYNLGVAYGARGLVDKAIEHYLQAIRVNPDFLEAHYNLAHAYYSQGLFNKAAKHYREVIRLKPDWEKPHFHLGRIFLEKGDREKAKREFKTVLQINPQDHEAQKLLDSITQR